MSLELIVDRRFEKLYHFSTMQDTDKKILTNLTQNQATFLKVLLKSDTVTANASGIASDVRFSGKIVHELQNDGVIEPMGFANDRRQWTLTPEWEEKKKELGNEIEQILDKITGS